MTQAQALKDAIERWASNKADIESVWLVGSRAWGTPHPDSDFDFLIKASLSAYATGTMFGFCEEDLARETGLNVHLMSDEVPFHERGRIPERDGILLYSRPKSCACPPKSASPPMPNISDEA